MEINLHFFTFRFETKVFDYNGPTIASFRLASNEIYTIASDQEWM